MAPLRGVSGFIARPKQTLHGNGKEGIFNKFPHFNIDNNPN